LTGAIIIADVVFKADSYGVEASTAAEGRRQEAVPGPLRRADRQTVRWSGAAERRDLRRKRQQRETGLRLVGQRGRDQRRRSA